MKHDLLLSELAERLEKAELYIANNKDQHDLLIQQIFLKLAVIQEQNEEILKRLRRLDQC
jgi:hypothetical protein